MHALQAVMTLDVGCPVGDAAWAPCSSTVLAAACEDGRLMVTCRALTLHPVAVHACRAGARTSWVCMQVFDLAHSKSEPLSKQKIVGKGSLTRLAFNAQHPVILVGDDR
jgi:dynein intermediate chain 1